MTEKPFFSRLSDPFQECPKNAWKVLLNTSEFLKMEYFTTLILGYFCPSKITKPL